MYVLVNRRIFEMAGITLPERIFLFSTLIRWGKALARIQKKHPEIYPTAMPVPAEWHNVMPYLEYLGQMSLTGITMRTLRKIWNGFPARKMPLDGSMSWLHSGQRKSSSGTGQ